MNYQKIALHRRQLTFCSNKVKYDGIGLFIVPTQSSLPIFILIGQVLEEILNLLISSHPQELARVLPTVSSTQIVRSGRYYHVYQSSMFQCNIYEVYDFLKKTLILSPPQALAKMVLEKYTCMVIGLQLMVQYTRMQKLAKIPPLLTDILGGGTIDPPPGF